MKIGILQPHKLGDIIITIPIAEYHLKTIDDVVIWPVLEPYCNFLSKVIDPRIKFTPINSEINNSIEKSKLKLSGCDKIIDLSFGFRDSDPELNSRYSKQNEYTFDRFKYLISGVPFEEKWNLNIKRDIDDENNTYSRVVKNKKYCVLHVNTVRGLNINEVMKKFKIPSDEQIIHIDSKYDGVTGLFSWLKILEGASTLILTNSSVLNLVNQLNINEKNRIYIQSSNKNKKEKDQPVLKNDWVII